MVRDFYTEIDSQIIEYQKLIPYLFYALQIPNGTPQD